MPVGRLLSPVGHCPGRAYTRQRPRAAIGADTLVIVTATA